MLRVNRAKKALVKLDKRSLPDSGLTEPYDLQQMIRNSPDAFFAEMEETLLLLGEEVRPAEFVEDRIDLLLVCGFAFDPHGGGAIPGVGRKCSRAVLRRLRSVRRGHAAIPTGAAGLFWDKVHK
jgi:hypothetical protein